MSRFAPLFIFVIWMASQQAAVSHLLPTGLGLLVFLSVYLLLVLLARWCSVQMAKRASMGNPHKHVRGFNAAMMAARLSIPAWFAVGVFFLGWRTWVGSILTPHASEAFFYSPSLLLGSMPAFFAWMGLWWSQYPADQVLRHHNMIDNIDLGLPTHTAPSFWNYFFTNLRFGLLFSILPVIILMVMRDVLALGLHQIGFLHSRGDWIDTLSSMPATLVMLFTAPAILRHVIQTEPLPDCPLRRRLEEICRRNGINYRELLLWRTQHQMGNAAVMGLIAPFRYILLSDLLLESMDEEQIEAVFAHELGHVKHRHLLWLTAAIGGMALAMAGPGQWFADKVTDLVLSKHIWFPQPLQISVWVGSAVGVFALLFGFVSRQFERQADVFAVRAMQGDGPKVYTGALRRVAMVNNIPIEARSWCHGSIMKRIRFVSDLGINVRKSKGFDRWMWGLNMAVILALCIFGGWAIAAM